MFIRKFKNLHKRDFWPVAVLLIIALVSHWRWLDLTSTLNYSDWSYWPNAAIKESLSVWGAWLPYGLGTQNIQIPFLSFVSVWSLLANIGFSYDFGVKLTFFIPIAILGFISPYILMRKMTDSSLAALSAALYYGSNTYFLVRQTAHLPIALVYALAPLILWRLIVALDVKNCVNWLWFGLLFCLGVGFEIRIMYIVSIILAVYFCVVRFAELRKAWPWAVGSMVMIAAINVYWLMPTIFGGGLSGIAETTSRNLFGNFLFDMPHALTASDSSWTGSMPNQAFISQTVQWQMWLIPILVLCSVLIYKRLKTAERKYVLFFWIISLIGIFLTKQSTDPLPGAYIWLYGHFPGFSLFREASKFYLLTAFGYMGLLSYLFIGVRRGKPTRSRYWAYATIGIVAMVALINLKPLFTTEINTLFSPRHMPQEYKVLQEFIDNQSGFFRTYWAPKSGVWAPYSSLHPKLDGATLVGSRWGLGKPSQGGKNEPIQNQIADITNGSASKALLDAASVKYVIIPFDDPANDDRPFKYYGNDRDFYVNSLKSVPWLKRIDIGTKDIIIYENTGFDDHVSVLDDVISLDSQDNLNDKFSLLKSVGRATVNFAEQNSATRSLALLNELFSKINLSPTAGFLNYTVKSDDAKAAKVYKKTSAVDLNFSTTAKTLSIYTSSPADPQVNGNLLSFSGDKKRVLMSTSITQDLYILLDNVAIPVKGNTSKDLGRLSSYGSMGLYTLGSNKIANGSFENGLWQDKVGDCNKYDDNGLLAMSSDATTYSDGKKSLRLEATNHIACTSTKFQVAPSEKGILNIDYQSDNSKQAGFYVQFDDPAATIIKGSIAITDTQWHSMSRQISIPANAHGASLAVYAYSSDGRVNNVVRYDNISFRQLSLKNSVALPSVTEGDPVEATMSINSGANSFQLSTEGYDTHNLIPNSSFENGLWRSAVGDCNNYDRNGKIAMSLVPDHTEGSKSLQLEATRHNACTGTTFNINNPGEYLFSFDYLGVNTKAAGYNIQFDDVAKTSLSEQLVMNKVGGWELTSKQLKIPAGATSAALTVYAYASDGQANNIVRYDNFSFRNIPETDNTYFLLTEPSSQMKTPGSIKTDSVNSTKFGVVISKATLPFVLSFAEAFNDGWKLYLEPVNGKPGRAPGLGNDFGYLKAQPLFDMAHFKINGYANGWTVDPLYIKTHFSTKYWRQNADGSLDFNLVIYFRPQSWFYVGLVISSVALVGCVGFLVFARRQRRRKLRRTAFYSTTEDQDMEI